MRAFAALYDQLDATTSTNGRLAALRHYFETTPPADAAWALWILTGMKMRRVLPTAQLRAWACEWLGMPDWLFEESYTVVGDLAETISLLVDGRAPQTERDDVPLHVWMTERLPGLRDAAPEQAREVLQSWWAGLSGRELFVVHKLLTGGMRVGVARTLVERAAAEALALPLPTVAERLMGTWEPSAAFWEALQEQAGTTVRDPSQPYPFFLAHPVESGPEALGDVSEWQIEWKWDGIRGQLIRREQRAWLWSRGEELVTDRFPEISEAAQALPDGTVLDGEILAWRDDAPLPFQALQTRIGRKTVSKRLREEIPVRFVAYDVLEWQGEDVRERPLAWRRALLEGLVSESGSALGLSPRVVCTDWAEAAALRSTSRERGAEGFMLKRSDSPYRAGRKKGDWFKWKVDPMTLDAVMIYAQAGHGRRANLHTDYTFAVWHEGALTPVAKAYSGLTDAELQRIDAWIRKNTREKFGPVRSVEPVLVFELGFEGIQESPRHKSGIALRFPRILRWREDKRAEEADSLEAVRRWLTVGPTAPQSGAGRDR
jgi:DNA ligase-1